MELTQTSKAEYRFGEYGPGYLLRGPRTDFGVVQLRPGDDASNHYHAQIEESFVVLEGTCTLWIDCERSYRLCAGDVVRCDPGEMHYFVNESDELFRALFVKAPYDPADGVQVPWVPGDPVPTEAIARAKGDA
ncbi:cupin domain-containing protein [Leucobacter muris]|uniref:Cupin domain-containing protein n=1 Tax=Leucobacter muris TaxID=1935379 RepID=A0ABX5QI41_9MICO|nr:cupin domain-containing protein [Leucobacter muris]QAB18762.1 cupin domain-containing protein [Leucobacter muris]